MKILVTGGAGFIGSSLTDELLRRGYTITILDNFNSYYNPRYKKENIRSFSKNRRFRCIEGDVTYKDILDTLFKESKYDKVIHLAASVGVRNSLKHSDRYRLNNINGTQNVLDMAGKYGVGHVIFASSSSIYGNESPMPFQEDRVSDSILNPYAETKKVGESLCRSHHEKFGTSMTVFRFFTVYGPKGRPDMSPYIFTESILRKYPITIYGDGTQKRDFTNIKDIVSGIVLGIERMLDYEVFNLGSSSPIDLMSFIRIIENITGCKAQLKFAPPVSSEMKNTFANINKSEKLLGYNQTVSINEGLETFIQWFKKKRLNNLIL